MQTDFHKQQGPGSVPCSLPRGTKHPTAGPGKPSINSCSRQTGRVRPTTCAHHPRGVGPLRVRARVCVSGCILCTMVSLAMKRLWVLCCKVLRGSPCPSSSRQICPAASLPALGSGSGGRFRNRRRCSWRRGGVARSACRNRDSGESRLIFVFMSSLP